ncbi:valine--tRNA ligase [bacterium]|nr:valine--tRNA ligase [bacterium]
MANQAQEISKAFDNTKETEIYSLWKESGYFNPDKMKELLGDKSKKHFGIPLPPPNANGDLHLGHTCGYAFQDLMGRYNRMTGHPTLLLPGKDHAGIQTEAVFTKLLEKEGKSKWDMGREEFYKQCYEFCMRMMTNAMKQEKRIGLSADWSRHLFTLDPRLTDIIYSTFYKLLDEGLIYRGKRITNICPHCKTALADIDTERMEIRGIFAYIVYPFEEEADRSEAKKLWGHEGIVVATTRPETMLADTAVAVNPKDKRYKKFVGKKVMLPFMDKALPIIADDHIDIETGTGALKVTPAHSPIDYEIGLRHKLDVVNVINEEGKMTGPIPERFKGMGTIECSKTIVKELDGMGLLVKIENIKHEVAVCERCKTPIEPIISKQWFVDMKPLAREILKSLKKGEVKVIPSGQQKALEHFLNNIQDWCISRQLWWGHRVPVWYSGGKELYDWKIDNPEKSIAEFTKETGKPIKGTGNVLKGDLQPETDPDWKGKPSDLWLEAETDMFDTWFSSGQWPFSTLKGLGGDNFEQYYPADVMETARDILFWWVARQLMLGKYITGKVPFHTVFLHGLILAEDGSKMSKSKGNTKEPTEIFDRYGADSLRLWYYNESLPGSNVPLREEKIKGNRNFVNKIWNASRFVLMNAEALGLKSLRSADVPLNSDRIKKTEEHVERIKKYIESYRFNLGAETIREFFWHTYCDKWIEEIKKEISEAPEGSKERSSSIAELVYILKENLKIMHPFMPFVTEAVWQELKKIGLADGILMVEQI